MTSTIVGLQEAIKTWNKTSENNQRQIILGTTALKVQGVGRDIFASYNATHGWRFVHLNLWQRFLRWCHVKHKATILKGSERTQFLFWKKTGGEFETLDQAKAWLAAQEDSIEQLRQDLKKYKVDVGNYSAELSIWERGMKNKDFKKQFYMKTISPDEFSKELANKAAAEQQRDNAKRDLDAALEKRAAVEQLVQNWKG